jgi:hypothetical protein
MHRVLRPSLRDDREGAIMVIAVFMAACLVGALWYTFGLGEAMLYREQLRAAADAAAFDAAVIHAQGMNMIAFLNVVMAALLGIIVFLTLLLILCIIAVALSAGTAALVLGSTIAALLKAISLAKTVIFPILTALNFTEASLAIAMPYAGYLTSFRPAGQYQGGVTQTWSWSMSMVPMRLPYVNNAFDARTVDALVKKWGGNVVTNLSNPNGLFGQVVGGAVSNLNVKTPLIQRYGLPVQDDTFGMLCMHAGMAVTGLPELVGVSVPSWIVQLGGQIVGYAPWVFCSGLDITQVLGNLPDGVLKRIEGIVGSFKSVQKAYPSMLPMKVFDEAKNGNDYMQVWSVAKGSSTATSGAVQGVAIAAWQSTSPTPDEGADSTDNAEAEFYFDCGAPGTKDDVTAGNGDVTVGSFPLYGLRSNPGNPPVWDGTDDTTGYWRDCKYNAMWNMRWKARLRRVHDAEWDVRRTVLLTVYQALGIESFVKKFFIGDKLGIDGGSLAKTSFLDPVKACFTSLGSGSDSGTGDFGNCPWSFGTMFGNWGGKVHPFGQSAGNAVLH